MKNKLEMIAKITNAIRMGIMGCIAIIMLYVLIVLLYVLSALFLKFILVTF